MSFTDNLRTEIFYKDIKIKELAKIIHIPYSTLLSYVSRKGVIPNIITGYNLSKALNTTVEFLVTGDMKYNFNENKIFLSEYLCLPEDVAASIKKLIHTLYLQYSQKGD